MTNHPYIWRCVRRTCGTQHIVVFLAQTDYSKVVRIHSWVVRRDTGRVGEIRVPSFLCSPPFLKGHTKHTFLPATYVRCFSPGKPTRDLVSKVFIEIGHIDILCLEQKNSRFPKGKQVFNIDHIVYANSLGMVTTLIS